MNIPASPAIANIVQWIKNNCNKRITVMTERIFLEVGNQVFQVVTQTLYKQGIYVLTHKII